MKEVNSKTKIIENKLEQNSRLIKKTQADTSNLKSNIEYLISSWKSHEEFITEILKTNKR